MKTLAIVQARLGGTRLPGKVLEEIDGVPMLIRVLDKVGDIVGDENVVLAVPYQDYRTLSAYWDLTISGPDEDVLSRFMYLVDSGTMFGKLGDHDSFVRFTADCPLLDVAYSQHLIGLFQHMRATNSDGSAPELLATHPDLDGLDTEIFTRQALVRAAQNARSTDREHVTSWMRRYLPTQIVTMPLLGGPIRWSVDDAGGLEFVRRVTGACHDCAVGVPHHSNAGSSIGGADRSLVLDLHIGTGGGLVECVAGDILRERLGTEWAYSSLPK